MESAQVCPKCGNQLPPNAPKGRCPRCLMARLIDEHSDTGSVNEPCEVRWSGNKERKDPGANLCGKTFGDYELLEEIARGGMGIVYRARQISLNRIVALKMILAGQLASEPDVRRFRTEAESAANLVHPNVIPLYEVGEHNGLQYFTMKLVEGGSLAARLPILVKNPRVSAKLLADVARAVHYAHQHGILHRDLKPANILFDTHDIPYVTDFGLAKCADNSDYRLTRTGAIIGTPAYMSPEQASGNSKALTTASDVYSLGVMLYEMLTGRVPFTGDSPLAILQKVKAEDTISPRVLNRKVDRDLEIICLTCMRKEPDRRYASAAALANDLERWLEGESIQARAATSRERLVKWVKRHPVIAVSAVMSAILLFSIAGVRWHNEASNQKAEAFKKTQREAKADELTQKGGDALKLSRAAKNDRKFRACESYLIDAQNLFRQAQFEIMEHAGAAEGLRKSAMDHFQLALDNRNWRQAYEKLTLARQAGLSEEEFKKNETLLNTRESERARYIRKRVDELMADAASNSRQILHEIAAYELISLKDPVLADELLRYVDHASPDCSKLAIAALGWCGEERAVSRILPYVYELTPAGRPNPLDVQEAAVCAICMLAGEGDLPTYKMLHHRIWTDTVRTRAGLTQRVRPYFEPYARRMASNAGLALGAEGENQTHAQWHLQASRHSEARQWKEAIACLDKGLELEPNNVYSLHERAHARNQYGDFKGAIADCEAAIRVNPQIAGIYLNRAVARTALGDVRAGMEDCDKALELEPANAMALTNRAMGKLTLRDLKGAYDDVMKSINIDPQNAQSFLVRASINVERGARPVAYADIERAIELNPRYDAAYVQRAEMRLNYNKWNEAMLDATKALELNPNNASAYSLRANAKIMLGDRVTARADCDRAIELEPRASHSYFNRGNINFDDGDLQASIADYTKAIELRPGMALIYANRGQSKYAARDYQGALIDLNKALELDASIGSAYQNRALTKAKLKDSTGAVADFEKSFSLQKATVKMHVDRGIARLHMGDLAGASADFKAAQELQPDVGESYFRYGKKVLANGDYDNAIYHFEAAIGVNPKDEAAKTLLKEAQSKKDAAKNL